MLYGRVTNYKQHPGSCRNSSQRCFFYLNNQKKRKKETVNTSAEDDPPLAAASPMPFPLSILKAYKPP
jgi:hypothetical protein